MIITKEWIHAHRTPAGAWNRKQIEALGLEYPARKGWIGKLVGTEIAELAKAAFEIHSDIGQKRLAEFSAKAFTEKYKQPIAGGWLGSQSQQGHTHTELERRVADLESKLIELEGFISQALMDKDHT
jgi:hypothetical protein